MQGRQENNLRNLQFLLARVRKFVAKGTYRTKGRVVAQQTDLEVAVLNSKIKTLAGALLTIAVPFPQLIDPAAEGRAAIRGNRMNMVTAQAALINTGLAPAWLAQVAA